MSLGHGLRVSRYHISLPRRTVQRGFTGRRSALWHAKDCPQRTRRPQKNNPPGRRPVKPPKASLLDPKQERLCPAGFHRQAALSVTGLGVTGGDRRRLALWWPEGA